MARALADTVPYRHSCLAVDSDGERSQGGVEIPTGGDGPKRCFRAQATARERPSGRKSRRGQQIRLKSEADGESPDGRERERPVAHSARGMLARMP